VHIFRSQRTIICRQSVYNMRLAIGPISPHDSFMAARHSCGLWSLRLTFVPNKNVCSRKRRTQTRTRTCWITSLVTPHRLAGQLTYAGQKLTCKASKLWKSVEAHVASVQSCLADLYVSVLFFHASAEIVSVIILFSYNSYVCKAAIHQWFPPDHRCLDVASSAPTRKL
jgi:hypothetical protein